MNQDPREETATVPNLREKNWKHRQAVFWNYSTHRETGNSQLSTLLVIISQTPEKKEILRKNWGNHECGGGGVECIKIKSTWPIGPKSLTQKKLPQSWTKPDLRHNVSQPARELIWKMLLQALRHDLYFTGTLHQCSGTQWPCKGLKCLPHTP